jgi:hypothetical protein
MMEKEYGSQNIFEDVEGTGHGRSRTSRYRIPGSIPQQTKKEEEKS